MLRSPLPLDPAAQTVFDGATSLFEVFTRRCAQAPLAPALRFRKGRVWRALTWAQWSDAAARMCEAMRAQGLGPGDRIALVAPASARWCVAHTAVLQLGASSVAIDPRLPAHERQEALRSLQCSAMWHDLGGQEDSGDEPMHAWQLDSTPVEQAWRRPPRMPAKPEAPVQAEPLIVSTQGTTGAPRAVEIPQARVISRAVAVANRLRLTPGDEVSSWAPVSHAWTQVMLWSVIIRGATLTPVAAPDLDELEAIAPHVVFATPDQLETLRRNWENERWTGPLARLEFRTGARPRVVERAVQGQAAHRHKARLGGNLRAIVTAPARLRPHTAQAWGALGRLLESYGQTELGGIVSLGDPVRPREGTAGPLLEGIEARVTEEGVLEVEDTSNEADAWSNTRDLARLDGSFVRVEGRAGDLPQPLQRTGRKLEDELAALPLVRRAVLGTTSAGVTALLQLDEHHARRLAAAEGWHPRDLVDLVQHPQILRLVRDGLVRAVGSSGASLDAVAVSRSPWTVETGLLSVLGEPRRAALQARFPDDFVLVPHARPMAFHAR